MAHVVDVRGANGEFVILGEALTLPTSDSASTPMSGSLRFNDDSNEIEVYLPQAGESPQWVSVLVNGSVQQSYVPLVGGTISGDLTVTGTVTVVYADGGADCDSWDGSYVQPGVATVTGTETMPNYGPWLPQAGGMVYGDLTVLGSLNASSFQTLSGMSFLGDADCEYYGTSDPNQPNETDGGPYLGLAGGTITGNLIVFGTLSAASWVGPADAGSYETPGYLPLSGGTITGNLLVTGDVTAAVVNGSADESTYADVAERYHADAPYEPGTVLVIGGCHEVTISTRPGHTELAGVVSTQPAIRMNKAAGSDATHPYVALRGRVPCKVSGPVRKGQMLMTSAVPGHAMAAPPEAPGGCLIGRALANFDGDLGVVEVLV